MHNHYFKSLYQFVDFFNLASVMVDPIAWPPGTAAEEATDRDCWLQPELTAGNEAQVFGLLGDLGLTRDAAAAIAAYLKKSTDTETPVQPRT